MECRVDEDRTSRIDSYVGNISDIVRRTMTILTQLRSIQSRMRSHLVYEAKRHVARLYGFDQNCSREYIRKQVRWLLVKDRFTCQREKKRERFWKNIGGH